MAGRVGSGNGGGNCGAGDVAGVRLGEGCPEKVIEDGLEG